MNREKLRKDVRRKTYDDILSCHTLALRATTDKRCGLSDKLTTFSGLRQQHIVAFNYLTELTLTP